MTRGQQAQPRMRIDTIAGPVCTSCGSRFTGHTCHLRVPPHRHTPRPRPGRVPYTEILALHQQLTQTSLTPTKDLAAVYCIPVGTAASWVSRARKAQR